MNKEKKWKWMGFGVVIIIMVLAIKPILALNLVLHIPEKYLEVVAGDRLTFELDIKYPENPKPKYLKLTYQIKKGGGVVSEMKATKTIENQSSFMEYIVVPQSLDVGTYTLMDRVQDYANLDEEVSTNFRVVKGKDDLMKYIYILGLAIGIVDVLVIIQFFMILGTNRKEGEI